MPLPLTDETMISAARELERRHGEIAGIVATYGIPPLWQRAQGFETLVYIILEQQVSLASARAIYRRLKDRITSFTPETYLAFSDETLREIGLSRQKIRYTKNLAQALATDQLVLEELPGLENEAVRHRLTAISGIGDWTATIYLMMALRHPDVWPQGDRALAVAVQKVNGLDTTPDQNLLTAIGEEYRPWRSVAARLYWFQYLDGGSPAPDIEVSSV
ncbi:MAG: DNA-3-methyladenine glycosylase 2 family protein [Candidatus Latescibacteria bacterium]|nr:DNA-3-methyladenine glycosylase 2 family protein [Candidatus Latescibacterota bacterium]